MLYSRIPRKAFAIKDRRAARFGASGFTLVELLVSMAVLVVLVFMVSRLVDTTSATVNSGTQLLDADNEARTVFNRMASDFEGMLRRPDVDCTAYYYNNYAGDPARSVFKRRGNDSLFFFSEAPGYTGTSSRVFRASPIAAVGYRIWDAPGTTSISPLYSLERWGGITMWDSINKEGGMVYLTFKSDGSVDTQSTLAGWGCGQVSRAEYAPNCHAIGDQIYRLEFSFLLKNGAFWKPSPSVANPTNPIKDMRDVSAIVATIAILDNTTRAKISDISGTLSDAVSKLVDDDDASVPDAPYNPAAVAGIWRNALVSDASIPRLVAANTRVYQRYFYLK